jgi:Secretion system C-terminal sorting domain
MRRYLIGLLALVSHVYAQDILCVQSGVTLSIKAGTTVIIEGGIVLDNGDLLNAGTIKLKGDWTDTTATPNIFYGQGTVVFNGTGRQKVSSKKIFGRVDINTGSLELEDDMRAGKWYLINGVINTGGFKVIVGSTVPLALEPDSTNPLFANSWINGNLRRNIDPSLVNTYSFPVSNASSSRLAVLDNLLASPLNNVQYVDVSFGSKPGTDAGLAVAEQGTPYSSVNTSGVWYITPDVQPSSGKYDLEVYFNGFAGLEDNKFAILERPTASSDALDWVVPAGSVLPAPATDGRIVSAGYARRNNFSAFGQFGIGMTLSALPVTLTDFTAKRVSSYAVAIDWSTASEQNNRGYTVERQLENETFFSPRGFVPSAAAGGNSSNLIEYHFTDQNAGSGKSYYRLKQINFDNGYTYTEIKTVAGVSISISLYPNPARGQINIRIEGSTKNYSSLITDAAGRTVKTFSIAGNNTVPVNGLAAGSYILTIQNFYGDGRSYNEKIIIN